MNAHPEPDGAGRPGPIDPTLGQPRLTDSPIFVIGSPRSGTSILAKSLGEHPDLWSADETQLLWDLFREDGIGANYGRGDLSWLRRQGIERRDAFAFVGMGLNALLTRQSGGRRWLDDTPIYTLIVDRVAALFPTAMFVHIARDGRRVVHSMMNYLNIYSGDPAAIPWASDFEAACRAWANHVKAALSFEEREPARCLTVPNEDLVADPTVGFARILEFLSASPHEGPATCFATTRINSSFRTPSNAPARDPWDDWSSERRSQFEEIAGECMERLGYASALEPDEAHASR
jgi:hypothetical protein